MLSESSLHEPRTNAEQSETLPKFRVTHESHGRDLYFVRVIDGPVKIGCANNVSARLKVLQCGNHCELELLGFLPGRGSYEGELHAFLQPCRLRGEWFERCPEIEAEIEQLVATRKGRL